MTGNKLCLNGEGRHLSWISHHLAGALEVELLEALYQ